MEYCLILGNTEEIKNTKIAVLTNKKITRESSILLNQEYNLSKNQESLRNGNQKMDQPFDQIIINKKGFEISYQTKSERKKLDFIAILNKVTAKVSFPLFVRDCLIFN